MDYENEEMNASQPEGNRVEQASPTLEVTAKIQSHLGDAGRWSKFLAILGFNFMGLLVLVGIIMSIAMAIIPNTTQPGMPFPPLLIGVFYLVVAGIYFLPLLYLYRFSTQINKALRLKNQEQFASAFSNLKAHYRFIGIMMIIGIALYVLIVVVMIAAGLFSGFSGLGGMRA